MKAEKILEKYKKLPIKDVENALTKHADSLFHKNWCFIPGPISSTTPGINGSYVVKIGSELTLHKCNEHEANEAGYVMTIQHMYHERQHIQQIKEQNISVNTKYNKDIDRMTNIVRRNFIQSRYNSAYSYNYEKDPGELDAEVYGLKMAIEYFKTDTLVSSDKANQILFEFMMSDDYGHKNELNKYNISSIEDMMNAFIDIRDTIVHEIYSIQIYEPSSDEHLVYEDMTEDFLTLNKFRTHRDEFKKCKDGILQDKILEQTILMEYPDISQHPLHLREELETCKRQMDSKLHIPRHHVVPANKIKYAGYDSDDLMSDGDGFTKAVNSLSNTKGQQL